MEINLLKIWNTYGQADQQATENEEGKIVGTVYTSFIDITDNQFFLPYKHSNENVINNDLNTEFNKTKKSNWKKWQK